MFNNVFKILMATVACLLLLSGCTSAQNLLTTDRYIQETIPHQQTYFKQVWAVEDDGEFRISGKLHFKWNGMHVPGYVEVSLLDESGSVIEKQKVAYYPRVLRGRKGRRREAKFVAYFSETPPLGSIVQLSHIN